MPFCPQAEADKKIEELLEDLAKLEEGVGEHVKGCADVVGRFEAIIGGK